MRFRLGLDCLCCVCLPFASFVRPPCSIASFLCCRFCVALPGGIGLLRRGTAFLRSDACLPCQSGLLTCGRVFLFGGSLPASGAVLACSRGFFAGATPICAVLHGVRSISEAKAAGPSFRWPSLETRVGAREDVHTSGVNFVAKLRLDVESRDLFSQRTSQISDPQRYLKSTEWRQQNLSPVIARRGHRSPADWRTTAPQPL